MNRKTVAALLAVMVIVITCASCGAKQPRSMVIGLTTPLSGGGAQYGTDVQRGLEMAIEDINKEGGIKAGDTTYQVKLKSLDDRAEPEQGVNNATRLVSQDGAKIIWCPVATVIFPLLEINEKRDEEFLIMAYTSIEQVTDEGNKLIAMIPPPFTVYTERFAILGMEQGWTKMAMVQTSGAYGEAWAKGMGFAWQAAGGTITTHARADYYTETDFTPYLSKALATNPDVLLVGGPTKPTALVIEQAKGLGFQGGFIIMDQAKIDGIAAEIGIDKVENCIGVAPVQDPFPATPRFAERYQAKYGEPVTWESAINYTGMFVLKKAVEDAKTIDDVAAIRKSLAKALPVSGEEFPVAIDGIESKGLMHMPSAITMVKNGQYLFSKEFIYWWKD
jgi:branched-chain amino acid transport system substrate-binding protein